MEAILERMRVKKHRSSMYNNYYKIWTAFNRFVVKLDVMPSTWERRTVLYCAYLVDQGIQSSTLRSCVSAIKCMVMDFVNYPWDDSKILLNSLVKACKISNDRIQTRLPIHLRLLEMIQFEINRMLGGSQPYLELLYQTIFALGYYGLFRIGELVASKNLNQHAMKAKDVYVAENKQKILIILYTSKTHGLES